MGVETSASHLIFFIGTVTVAVVVVGAMSLATQSFTDSLESKGKRIGNELASDITILNDPTQMVYNRTTRDLTLYVKNTGSMTLDAALLEVYINGTFWTMSSSTLLGGASSWQATKSVQIVVQVYLPAGDHSLKIIAQTGTYDTLNFRVS